MWNIVIRMKCFLITLFIILIWNVECHIKVEGHVNLSEVYDKLNKKISNAASYDKLIQPIVDEGHQPVTVNLNVALRSITSIDEKEMKITINIFLRQRWVDSRLDIGLNESVPINANWESNMWLPDTFFPDALTETTYKVTTPNKMLFIGPGGHVLHSQRLSLSLKCHMDLQNFPMDSQKCKIQMESYGYTAKQLIYKWHSPIELNSDIQDDREALPQFVVTSAFSEPSCLLVYSTGNFSCLRGYIALCRQTGFYMAHYYLPSILIVCLSCLSFWLDPEAVAARASLGLLTLLFTATQSSSASSNMPKMSYIKALDIFFTTTIIFCFSAIVEFILANMWQRGHNKKCKYTGKLIIDKSEKIKPDKDNNMRQITEFDFVDVLRQSSQAADNSIRDPEVHMHNQLNGNPQTTNHNIIYDKDIIFGFYFQQNPIDRAARWCFPIAFLIFNIVYWSYFKLITS